MVKKQSSSPGLAAPPAAEESAIRERIVAGARKHFFAHGFRGVTMDDLAAELGMSKKTLYAHFASKLALLEAVVRNKMDEVDAALDRVAEQEVDDFPGRLRELLSLMRSHTEEISAAYIRDIRREAPEIFEFVQKRRREFIQRYFGKLLQDGRKSGSIRKDISIDLMIEMLMGAVDAVINPAKMEELGMAPKAGFVQIISIFLDGVVVRKEGNS